MGAAADSWCQINCYANVLAVMVAETISGATIDGAFAEALMASFPGTLDDRGHSRADGLPRLVANATSVKDVYIHSLSFLSPSRAVSVRT